MHGLICRFTVPVMDQTQESAAKGAASIGGLAVAVISELYKLRRHATAVSRWPRLRAV